MKTISELYKETEMLNLIRFSLLFISLCYFNGTRFLAEI